jgi:hypothetical protein
MRNGFVWLVGIALIAAPELSAQSPPRPVFPGTVPEPPVVQTTTSQPPTPSVLPSVERPVDPPVFPTDPLLAQSSPSESVSPATPLGYWARAEFLSWWSKGTPVPIPLVTTGDPNNNPGAQLLNTNINFRSQSGMRFTLGGWFDCHDNFGIEGTVFSLPHRSHNFFVASDSTGNPLLGFPFFNQTPGAVGESVLAISSPGQLAGNVLVSASIRLWGAEANGVFCLWREPGFEWSLLAGYRYMDLHENLSLSSVTRALNNNTVTILSDHFNTRNQFSGGQLATRMSFQGDRLSLDVTGKIALGSTHQVVDIQGESLQFGPNAPKPGLFPGGFYAQRSNIGRYSMNQFTVIPAVELKLAYHFTRRFQMFVGYDFLYWNQVVRPGSQIDRNINLTQSNILGNTNGVLVGPAVPAPLFNRTDFWAQGINFGLEFRF